MAVKAMFFIKNPLPEGDGTYRLNLFVWAGPNNEDNVPNDAYFDGAATSATVNDSLNAFVKAYAEAHLNATFGMLDTVKCVNPVSLL